MLIREISPGSADWNTITDYQAEASAGLYAKTMSAFVQWLAKQYEEVRTKVHDEAHALRDGISGEGHKRTPAIVADLAVGLRYFLTFAHKVEAIDDAEVHILLGEGWNALKEAAHEQEKHQAASDPARRFIELLSAAIASGRAHIASATGSAPPNAGSFGWRVGTDEQWRAQEERLGWLNKDGLYIEPEASFAVAQGLARDRGESLSVSAPTLRKRLDECHLLQSRDDTRGTSTVRRVVEGRTLEVLHLYMDSLTVGLSGEEVAPKDQKARSEMSVSGREKTDSGTDIAREPKNEPEAAQMSEKNASEELTELTADSGTN